MFIIGLGTATPPKRFTQRECWDAFQRAEQFQKLAPRSRAILQKVLCGENGIETRHAAIDSLDEAFELKPDVLHARFAKHAPALATEAAQAALKDANCTARDIDVVLVSTCTGYLCPGLTSYVMERLGLKPNILALDLVGQGCGAALPNLRTAEAMLASGRADKVLSICVEVCSAAFFLDDDPGVLISACLFGDGAAAAVLSHEPASGRRRIQWKSTGSLIEPDDRDMLRFEQKEGMLRNILKPEVPELAAQHAKKVFDDTLIAAEKSPSDIAGWILHTGGRDVLQALRAVFNLSETDTRHSSAVLRDFGNISSPTVLFVLQNALHDSVPDGLWWMASFGAGFSCHGALLEVG